MKNNKNLHKVNDSFNKIENSKFINRWIHAPGPTEAFQISIVSAIVTVIAFIAGLSISISTHSSATLGYSLENLVDLVSSLIVLWRFHGGDTANKEELQKREKRASIGIALLMVILAICVFSVAVEHLAEGHAPSALHQLISLSVPSLLIFLILGILKFNIAIKTQSPAMKKDAVCSLGGAILSLGVLIGVGLFQSDDAIWWFDAFVAIIISILLGLYGVRTVVKNILEDKKYWTMKFWMEGKVYKNVDEQNLKGTNAGDDGISAGDIELGGDNL
jgi:divalent metal cation (Fe/Co/Zn/Cd) transporter